MTQQVNLFGGSLQIRLPIDFDDYSKFRGIPDNQEVWGSMVNGISIIIDICQGLSARQLAITTRAMFHYREIAELNGATAIRTAWTEEDALRLLPGFVSSCASNPKAQGMQISVVDGLQENIDLRLILVVIHLPQLTTDVLIELNIPLTEHAATSEKIRNDFMEVVDSLRIVNWDLFGE